jgi:MFS family permease
MSFSIFMLSSVQSVPETIIFYIALTGFADTLFWSSSEVLISTHSVPDRRVKNISVFIDAWILGFMIRSLTGKLILDSLDY